MFWGRLRALYSLQTLTHLSSGCRANLDSSVNTILNHSDTVQLTFCRRGLNRTNLNWTDNISLFCGAKTAIYDDDRSSAGITTLDNRQHVFGQLFVLLKIVSIIVKLRNDERRNKQQHMRLIALHATAALRIFHSSSVSQRDTYV